MHIAFYDTHSYDRESFTQANAKFLVNIHFFDFKLNDLTAAASKGFDAVCIFVNDKADKNVIKILKENGIKLIILRCAGYNNVDLEAAKEAGIKVVRVPEYSPYAVAEHAVALLLALTRHIPQSFLRTKTANFTLEGLTGRDLHGLTAGIFGTGKIGRIMAELLGNGFGMKIILFDKFPNTKWAEEHGYEYVDIPTIFKQSDVLSFHCPLTEETFHIADHDNMKSMKRGAVIINTGRGALIDSKALVHALKHKHIGGAALDVYEEESEYFFSDWSVQVIKDDVLARLLTFPNVIITSHQAFLTSDALANIADTSLENACAFERGEPLKNEVVG